MKAKRNEIFIPTDEGRAEICRYEEADLVEPDTDRLEETGKASVFTAAYNGQVYRRNEENRRSVDTSW